MIAVVDTGGANLASIVHALGRLGAEARITAAPEAIREAPRVILPGVGAAASSMERLGRAGLVEVIRGLRQPVLGICLGMQLLYEASAENGGEGGGESDTDCLGILPGRVERLRGGEGISVPHMGWNQVEACAEFPEPADYYFVHSYVCPEGPAVLARTEHGQSVPSICRRENFLGVQFHPERSGSAGARFLRSFLSS